MLKSVSKDDSDSSFLTSDRLDPSKQSAPQEQTQAVHDTPLGTPMEQNGTGLSHCLLFTCHQDSHGY